MERLNSDDITENDKYMCNSVAEQVVSQSDIFYHIYFGLAILLFVSFAAVLIARINASYSSIISDKIPLVFNNINHIYHEILKLAGLEIINGEELHNVYLSKRKDLFSPDSRQQFVFITNGATHTEQELFSKYSHLKQLEKILLNFNNNYKELLAKYSAEIDIDTIIQIVKIRIGNDEPLLNFYLTKLTLAYHMDISYESIPEMSFYIKNYVDAILQNKNISKLGFSRIIFPVGKELIQYWEELGMTHNLALMLLLLPNIKNKFGQIEPVTSQMNNNLQQLFIRLFPPEIPVISAEKQITNNLSILNYKINKYSEYFKDKGRISDKIYEYEMEFKERDIRKSFVITKLNMIINHPFVFEKILTNGGLFIPCNTTQLIRKLSKTELTNEKMDILNKEIENIKKIKAIIFQKSDNNLNNKFEELESAMKTQLFSNVVDTSQKFQVTLLDMASKSTRELTGKDRFLMLKAIYADVSIFKELATVDENKIEELLSRLDNISDIFLDTVAQLRVRPEFVNDLVEENGELNVFFFTKIDYSLVTRPIFLDYDNYRVMDKKNKNKPPTEIQLLFKKGIGQLDILYDIIKILNQSPDKPNFITFSFEKLYNSEAINSIWSESVWHPISLLKSLFSMDKHPIIKDINIKLSQLNDDTITPFKLAGEILQKNIQKSEQVGGFGLYGDISAEIFFHFCDDANKNIQKFDMNTFFKRSRNYFTGNKVSTIFWIVFFGFGLTNILAFPFIYMYISALQIIISIFVILYLFYLIIIRRVESPIKNTHLLENLIVAIFVMMLLTTTQLNKQEKVRSITSVGDVLQNLNKLVELEDGTVLIVVEADLPNINYEIIPENAQIKFNSI